MSFYCVNLPYRSDAAHYYAALADLPWAVWLDSGGMGRYDILTAAPQRTLQRDAGASDPFGCVRAELGELLPAIENVPFAGGALGYWGYDLVRKGSGATRSDKSMPAMAVGIYDWALVLDHQQKTARLVSRQRFAETASMLPQLLSRLSSKQRQPDAFRVTGEVACNFTRESYAAAFAKVQGYLQAGDCYQVNLAQCFSAQASGNAFGAYLALRQLSAAPYSAFISLPEGQILCASPERFLRVYNGSVETKPIKGTRPRDADILRDQQLAEELRNHSKDRAENLMIVDLLRNDLGKSCRPGSVRVPKLFEIESYANVHHMVSTVEGRLAPGRDALHVLQDCFPGGSVTGAPKHRAMQIIDQLEPDSRGIYCGAIGYVGFDGNMDSNIVIRTLVYSGGEIRCWAGGGIVADSQVDSEYQETLDKAAAMLKLLRDFGGKVAF